MLTLGVDLAARPKTTAACLIDWSAGRVDVVDCRLGLDDDAIVGLGRRADHVGIDCPLGWPDAFVDRVGAHHRFEALPPDRPDDDLRLRRTDHEVRRIIGRAPLSVSTDRIGAVALRVTRLLDRLGGPGLDRSGRDGVAEVYPGGALTCWGIDHRGYKRTGPEAAARRAEIGRQLGDGLAAEVDVPTGTDDELDAFICALISRAAALGATTPVPDHLRGEARREGWIHLPTGPLNTLVIGPADILDGRRTRRLQPGNN